MAQQVGETELVIGQEWKEHAGRMKSPKCEALRPSLFLNLIKHIIMFK